MNACELGRRTAERLDAERGPPLAHVRGLKDFVDLMIDAG
jgi:hypothetical protein